MTLTTKLTLTLTTDTDCNGLKAADSSVGGDTSSPVDAVIQVCGVPPGLENVALSPVANQNDNTINVFTKINTIAGSSHTMSVDAVIQSGGGAPCMVDVDVITNIDNDTTEVFANTDSSTGSTHRTSVDAVIQVNVSAPSHDNVDAITCSDSNAFGLFVQKLADVESNLVIRAILLKNNKVVYNFSYKIQGTENVQNATIAAANKVCQQYLGCALKSDTLVCSLRAGYNGVRVSITRNMHISRFISTLNKI